MSVKIIGGILCLTNKDSFPILFTTKSELLLNKIYHSLYQLSLDILTVAVSDSIMENRDFFDRNFCLAILNFSSNGIIGVDHDGILVFYNKAAKKILRKDFVQPGENMFPWSARKYGKTTKELSAPASLSSAKDLFLTLKQSSLI